MSVVTTFGIIHYTGHVDAFLYINALLRCNLQRKFGRKRYITGSCRILDICSDEGPMLETLDHTIRIGSTPTFLYFDLYLYSAYAAHYVYAN